MDHSPISSSPGDVQREARHRNGVGVFILLLATLQSQEGGTVPYGFHIRIQYPLVI